MKVSVLGATGSIGCSTAKVIEYVNSLDEGAIEVDTLVAGHNVSALAAQAKALNARLAVVADERQLGLLREALSGTGIDCAGGTEAVLEAAARPVDKTMAAICGTAGLLPTLSAISAGNTILLANKEAMVCAGPLVKDLARKHSVEIIPVDSEHNAIYQVQEQGNRIESVTLTASGGPFRTWTLDDLRTATVESALAHPNWSMGAKNSLDSATLMNKGLELIEAAYLFDLDESQIEIVVHPQSIVHALVTYEDGSVLAQMGTPDMRIPIAHALGGPNRLRTEVRRLNLLDVSRLDFEAPDLDRFPALSLARMAARHGPVATCVFNAANERAGKFFLNGMCGFLAIADLVQFALEKALDNSNNEMPRSVATAHDVLHVTDLTRRWVKDHLEAELKV